MRVLFCSSETAPFAKTGGLADVSSALPAELRSQGVQCDVVMPLYRSVKKSSIALQHVADISFLSGQGISQGRVFSHGPVYFIENDLYFNRDGYYSYQGRDFPDNLERFAFFSRACVELATILEGVDLIHCNDWQTALIPAYLHALGLTDFSTCYTIHNLAYQGVFDSALWPMLFLPYEMFRPDIMEYYGNINVMKAGIVFADMVTTVSPSYAAEIQTPEFGAGLDGLLRAVSFKLAGIVNGIDIRVWDLLHDEHIAQRFSIDDLRERRRASATFRNDSPSRSHPGRLCPSSAAWWIRKASTWWSQSWTRSSLGAQVVVLGTETAVTKRTCSASQPAMRKARVVVGFDESLAHVIEASADFFLMPSRFEPCGLNQMISMRYGTIPIVTCVGGLKDTVTALGEGTTPPALG